MSAKVLRRGGSKPRSLAPVERSLRVWKLDDRDLMRLLDDDIDEHFGPGLIPKPEDASS